MLCCSLALFLCKIGAGELDRSTMPVIRLNSAVSTGTPQHTCIRGFLAHIFLTIPRLDNLAVGWLKKCEPKSPLIHVCEPKYELELFIN